jgi:glycogen debranching enzyme
MTSAAKAERPAAQAAPALMNDEPRLPPHAFALKQGDTFLVADAYGDILTDSDGLFRNDTRVLSRLSVTLAGKPLARLSSAVSPDNVFFVFHGTNRPLPPIGEHEMPKGVVHIVRRRFLWLDRLYERLTFENYSGRAITLPLWIEFGADFCDMFEVRGFARKARGERLVEKGEAGLVMRYHGLDGVLRTTCLAFSIRPARVVAGRAEFDLRLEAHGCDNVYFEAGAEDAAAPGRTRYRLAAARARLAMRAERRRGASLRSASGAFDAWLQKSRADLALLTTQLPSGPYPYAGVPWFSTPFGRDGVITALQTLWIDPALARGVLAFLAETQAHASSAFRAADPGKILHESRRGEMTALGEVPYGRYYGAADTTPLFVVLAGAYAERTGDSAFIATLWPVLQAATRWIERACDENGLGFLSYTPSPGGLINQAWKDSDDSVFHADGSTPEGPIAAVEVQGYAFCAFAAMAELAERYGEKNSARHWRACADRLREAVEVRFWMEESRFYALALDGEGKPCRVHASNPGHLLYCGLPSADRAAAVAERLMSGPFNSGWGIRTLARGESRFNPMSYHNGSVWPHDTALCAAGLARYGRREDTLRILAQMFETAGHFGMQLPELFCGFERDAGHAPIAYPVACLPQAWAAGSVFMLLQACLGIRVDGAKDAIQIDRPALPRGVDRLEIRRLAVGTRMVDLCFFRVNGRVNVEPIGKTDAPILVRA